MSSSSPENRVITVVVDPAQDIPLALNRALKSVEQQRLKDSLPENGQLKVLLSVDCDNTDTSAQNPAMYRDRDWFFDRVLNPLQESGVDFSIDFCWSSDWYGSILNSAEKHQSNLIMLPLLSNPSGRERIFNESIWRLMRTAKKPVLVVRPESPSARNVVLAAVNTQSHKPEYQRLNELIINRSRWLAESYGSELHVVNAYSDSLHYPDRAQLANSTNVDTANIHVNAGDPDDVIAQVASDVGADLVVLGTRNRSSRWRGNTAEKIITKVSCDILAIS